MDEGQHNAAFVYVRLLGQGGQADVYLLRHVVTGMHYAVKFLREAWDEVARAAFRREALRQLRMAGDRVVRVLGWNFDGPQPFIVLEFMPNGSLEDELKHGPMSLEDGLRAAREIAIALAELHARGVVHRDVKPANVLRDATGVLKLNDLGVGVTMSAEQFIATHFEGTPAYAAPEQRRGVTSAKSDVYALGITLYQLLSGTVARRTLGERLGRTGAEVDKLLSRLCASEPRDRPSSLEAIQLIDAVLGRVRPPVAVRPPPPQSASPIIEALLAAATGAVGVYALHRLSSWDANVQRHRDHSGRFTP